MPGASASPHTFPTPPTFFAARCSLLERIIRHRTGCPKCDRGEGHPVAVLAVGYPGKVTRQISLRKEQVSYVERYLTLRITRN
jgi:hypothetical protein